MADYIIMFLGAIVGYLLGLEFVFLGFVLFVAYTIYTTDEEMERIEQHMEEERAYWKERVKRGFPGIRL